MKKLSAIFVFMLMCSSVALAQQNEKQMQREARKEASKKEQDSLFVEVEKMVNDMSFMIPVDKIDLKYGTSIFSNPRTNFIIINGKNAILQLSPNNSAIIGPNGLGGITVDGSPSNVNITKDKRGNLNISMSIQGVAISAQVSINIPKGSDRAIVNVLPNFNSYRIILKGQVIHINNTDIFKGRVF